MNMKGRKNPNMMFPTIMIVRLSSKLRRVEGPANKKARLVKNDARIKMALFSIRFGRHAATKHPKV